MKKTIMAILILVVTGLSSTASRRNRNISVDEARREVMKVASQHRFPSNFRLMKMGNLKVGQNYFHIFTTYVRERQRWRTLVFSNSGNYLGFYETSEEPLDLDAGEILFPGADIDVTDDDGDSIGGENVITFTEDGPPEVADLADDTYRFVSSPMRLREADPAYRFLLVAEDLVDAMQQRKYWQIHEMFSVEEQGKLTKEETREAFINVRKKVGDVQYLDYPWLRPPDTAIFPVTFKKQLLGLKLMLSEKDQITGLWVLPYAEAFPDLGPHQTRLTLPYDGRWQVLWGGPTEKNNRYYGSRARRYALEFVIADRYGKDYQEDGKRNEDYFCFGRPVLAPAAGTVIKVINGLEDNKPHRASSYSSYGNAVIIQHLTNEVSVIGHLKLDSIVVKEGDTVRARQPIGRCGNSGDSIVPSIYYHLQNSPFILSGSGYRLVFRKVLVWSRGRAAVLDELAPLRGQYIEQHSIPIQERSPSAGRSEPEAGGK